MRRASVSVPALSLLLLASLAPTDGLARPPRHLSPPAVEAPSTREAPADGLAVLRTPGPDRILIRAGSFMMGSDEIEVARTLAECKAEEALAAVARSRCREELFATEFPEHEVYLSDYWIDRTEVTVASFERCVAAGACSEPPFASGGERFARADFPVTLVTWQDASAYCAWAGGRLPTEAEWERAARGPKSRRYPWGNVWSPFLANHGIFGPDNLDDRDGFLELAPVGSFPDGRTPDGLVDMAGNVDEWVADWYMNEYPKESTMNPKGPDAGDFRVVRGGSYGGSGSVAFIGYRLFEGARFWLRGAASKTSPACATRGAASAVHEAGERGRRWPPRP